MAKVITDEKIIDELLTRGVENIYPDKVALKKLLMSGRQIRLYCGYDPTAPTLHIGHGITIRKLARFQQLGHKVIFLFGDFTAQIGDPTDKLSARQPLTHAQVMANLKNWKKQIRNIIDVKNIEFKFNSRWLNRLKFADLVKLSSYFTAQQMLARSMFKERMSQGKDLYLNEFLYPMMQAYDSVAMEVDLEIGGNDQMFNMLAGRDLMKKMKGREKLVLTTKLLEDPTGKKMGKSEGNMITLEDSPSDMYGKVMSWPDEMIVPALEILTDMPLTEIQGIAKQLSGGANPRDAKMELAYQVVKIYLGLEAADSGAENFKRVFQQGDKPAEIAQVAIDCSDDSIGVLELFVQAGLAKTNSEVRRLIKEGAIKIDDQKVANEQFRVDLSAGRLLLQRGKKQFVRVVKK
ncbi:MAG TPA: tyrosine--tRNA ligase [bacterium]|nr:tyrosine--tRNA ligase [bacterium]